MPIKTLFAAVSILLTVSASSAAGSAPESYPFPNRIIFSQTPEIGQAWHGGVRMSDIICWEFYWNVGSWFTLDFMAAGFTNLHPKDEESGGTINWTDNLRLLSIRSRPLTLSLMSNPYQASIGLVVQRNNFEFMNTATNEGISAGRTQQGGLFLVQSWRHSGRHLFNLSTSLTSHEIGGTGTSISTYYLIPGYRLFFGPRQRWSFDFEYYFMNPIDLPFKTLQYALDPDVNEFYNPDQLPVSFMFWGFSCSWRHLRLDLHVGNHISFAGLILPMVGIGWDF